MSSATSQARVQDAWQNPRNTRTLAAIVALKHEARAERLRELRRRKGVNQKELAEAIGSAPRTIQAWEQATSKPYPHNLTALADFYEVSVEYIEDGTAPAFDPQEDASQLDRIEAALLDNNRLLHEVLSRLGDPEKGTGTPSPSVPPGPPAIPQATPTSPAAPARRRSSGR